MKKPFSPKVMDKPTHRAENPATSQHLKGKLFVPSLLLLSHRLLAIDKNTNCAPKSVLHIKYIYIETAEETFSCRLLPENLHNHVLRYEGKISCVKSHL